MTLTYCGTTYTCATAVKCEDDNYIKLYDSNGVEIASFNDISDWSDFVLSGGSYIAPCDCTLPIPLSAYSIGAKTISSSNWTLGDDSRYYFEIASDLISANTATCDIILYFAEGTELDYEATQEAGKITLYTESVPLEDIKVESIQVFRA